MNERKDGSTLSPGRALPQQPLEDPPDRDWLVCVWTEITTTSQKLLLGAPSTQPAPLRVYQGMYTSTIFRHPGPTPGPKFYVPPASRAASFLVLHGPCLALRAAARASILSQAPSQPICGGSVPPCCRAWPQLPSKTPPDRDGHKSECAGLCIYVSVCACMSMCVHVCACMCMYVHVCARH
jgi:hypothetical protein